MAVLENQKHELFAQHVAAGDSDVVAYRKAYRCKQGTAESNATRLRENAGIVARITELCQSSATTLTLSLQEKREFLAAVIRTPVGEVDERSALCQSFKRVDTADGGHVEFKMPDKLKAIELDARLAGELKGDGASVNVAVAVNVMTEERRKELMEKKRAAIERRRSAPALP